MTKLFKTNAVVFVLLLAVCCKGYAQTRKDTWATKIPSSHLYNLYKVDDSLQRSEQPDKQAMQELAQTGVKSVLNLRKSKKDVQPKGIHLVLIHVGMKAGSISYDELVAALRAIEKAPKPVLVHCKHGADRTGCVVAAYCVIKHQYTKEEAIDELRNGGYNFHEKWYPNIIALLNSLDVEQLRKDVAK